MNENTKKKNFFKVDLNNFVL